MTTPDTLQARAEAKWVRLSARKARVVLEHVRGRSVPEARTVLAFTPRAAAVDIEKVLRSAVANAEVKFPGVNGDDLTVLVAYADEGPTLKRWKPRARGRVNRINKRTCHITLIVGTNPTLDARRRTRPAVPAATVAPAPTTPEPESKPKAKRRAASKAGAKKKKEAVA